MQKYSILWLKNYTLNYLEECICLCTFNGLVLGEGWALVAQNFKFSTNVK